MAGQCYVLLSRAIRRAHIKIIGKPVIENIVYNELMEEDPLVCYDGILESYSSYVARCADVKLEKSWADALGTCPVSA